MADSIRVSAIVAVASNRVIGLDNKMPWHLPADLKYFRAVTMGKPVLMGRKTFQSIGRPLPGRDNIVITRSADWQAEGVSTAQSLEAAIAAGKNAAEARGVDEIMIIGGAQIYALALPLTDRLYVTEVTLTPEGDSYFPPLDPAVWQETAREDHVAEGDRPAHSFLIYDRRI
ncbi:dihydrofolate reductase [Govanella unica]|uniref:Dihydrofolate reductase n=1 Tax=Govanella unica TaxID=2975056 RepID=A0A9X3Z6R4_9PROT|nr:dihydrofolate reductase [Govania unica]MDA5193411.1 dihydrofolate reductase [Govania unica]